MSEKTRVIRPAEERLKEIDAAIAKHEANIATLKAKRERILNPKPRSGGKVGIATVIKKAKELGMTPEQMMEKLTSN